MTDFAIEIKSNSDAEGGNISSLILAELKKKHKNKEDTESRLDIFCLDIANKFDLKYLPYFDSGKYILRFDAI